MMTKEGIFKLRDSAEQTRVQFKERVTRDNRYDVSCEMVAQSNSHGGMIVVGIDDKTGRMNPLSYQEVQETTNLLGNLASEGVMPQMLMGKYPQRWLPAFTVRCVSFVGNSIGGTEFRDKSGSDADGNAVHLYNYIISFLTRNLRQKQVNKDFNSQGELEVSLASLSEIVTNGILHRSYVIEAPMRVFIFDNRIEIHSPGLLPEGVSIESITHGVSVPRNKLLFNHGINLLPYTGAGSGITRAMKFTPDIKFASDEVLKEFVVTVERKGLEANDGDRAEEAKDNGLSVGIIGIIENPEKTEDGAEEAKDNNRGVRIPYKQLSGVQKNIIQYCSIPRTAKEIMDHIGYYNNSKNMVKLVKPLMDMGYIEMTEPEKPNSKNQKYRKVRKE